MTSGYIKSSVIQFYVHLTSFFIFGKILLFDKLIYNTDSHVLGPLIFLCPPLGMVRKSQGWPAHIYRKDVVT